MKEDATNEFARNFLSVVAGVVTAIAAAALLLPVINIFSDQFFHSYLTSTSAYDDRKTDLILEMSLFAWLFIASVVGGLVCTLISNRDIINVLISSLVSLAFVFIITKGNMPQRGDLPPYLLVLLGIPLGNLAGGWIGRMIKRRKRKQG